MRVNPINEGDLTAANGLLHGAGRETSYNENSNSMSQNIQNQMAAFGGYTLLHYVCASGNADIFEFIVNRLDMAHGTLQRSLLDQENQSKETPLHWAVLKNNYQIVRRLIEEHRKLTENLEHQDNADGEGDNREDESPKNHSVSEKYRGILDIENHNQQTPFFVAVIKGFLDIASILAVDSMSSVDAKDIVSFYIC